MEERGMRKVIHLSILIAVTLAVCGIGYSQDQPNRLSDREIKDLMSRMEKDAEHFKHSLHSELEHQHWRDSEERESMNRAASGFERATDRLKDHFHNGNARPGDVQEVLDRGADLNSLIVGRHLLPRARGEWMTLRSDLDQLASAYNVAWRWYDES
jgi:hypothetical protein